MSNQNRANEEILFLIKSRQIKFLVQIGESAVLPLIERLQNLRSREASTVIEALCEIGNPDAIEPLIGCLKNKNKLIRRHTAVGPRRPPKLSFSLVSRTTSNQQRRLGQNKSKAPHECDKILRSLQHRPADS